MEGTWRGPNWGRDSREASAGRQGGGLGGPRGTLELGERQGLLGILAIATPLCPLMRCLKPTDIMTFLVAMALS